MEAVEGEGAAVAAIERLSLVALLASARSVESQVARLRIEELRSNLVDLVHWTAEHVRAAAPRFSAHDRAWVCAELRIASDHFSEFARAIIEHIEEAPVESELEMKMGWR